MQRSGVRLRRRTRFRSAIAIVTISCGVRPSCCAIVGPFGLPDLSKLLDHFLDDVRRLCVARDGCTCSGTYSPRGSSPTERCPELASYRPSASAQRPRRSAGFAGTFQRCRFAISNRVNPSGMVSLTVRSWPVSSSFRTWIGVIGDSN